MFESVNIQQLADFTWHCGWGKHLNFGQGILWRKTIAGSMNSLSIVKTLVKSPLSTCSVICSAPSINLSLGTQNSNLDL